MTESNKMKEMLVKKLMVQMGIPMILSMALQAVYNIVDSAFVGNNVQTLERSFQLGYVPEKLPFLLGVPLPWAPPKGQTPAVFRYA